MPASAKVAIPERIAADERTTGGGDDAVEAHLDGGQRLVAGHGRLDGQVASAWGDLPVADPVGDGVVELHAHVSDHHVGKHSNQNRTGPHDDLRGESATSTRRSPMTRRGVRPTAARDRPRVGASLVAMRKFDVDKLVEGITQGNRALIAQSITLVESVKPAHRELAHHLLQRIQPMTGKAFRVGISGVPGAGKSTFINAMGVKLVQERNHRVAVLAVDPSSSRTGGSILGDRTRMADLAALDDVFVRPSPSAGHLGGVARATRESMLVLEAAGYDVVLVETVGVGQSEVAVSGMVDTFLMLQVARTGDQLQGIKRGILELADVIAITKADGDNEQAARVAARELAIAMKLISSDNDKRRAPVLTCSSYTGDGLDEVWEAVLKHRAELESDGDLSARRHAQQRDWLWNMVRDELSEALRTSPEVQAVAAEVEAKLDTETLSALEGAQVILGAFADAITTFPWGRRSAD